MDASAVVAGRDFLVWSAPFAASPGNAMPADTVPWGTTPGASFSQAGLTTGGINVSINIPRTDIRTDQLLDPVFRVPTGRDMRMTSDLAEMTVDNIQVASGIGTLSTVAPAGAAKGHDQLDIDASVDEVYRAIFYDILVPGDNEAFRVLAYKTLNVGNVNMQFRDTAAATIHLEAAVLPDTSATPTRIMAIRDVIPAV